MRWYADLYIGENAMKKADKIIKKVKKHKLQKNIYLITRAVNGQDLFDIYPSHVLLQKHYRNMDYLVIGIAIGYNEAVELVRSMVDKLYLKKGITDLKEYFGV